MSHNAAPKADDVTELTARPSFLELVDRLPTRKWPELLQLACFAWVVWLPVSLGVVLYPALALIFLTSILIIARDRIRLTKLASVILLVYIGFLVVWIGYGYARGNAGATHQLAVWAGSAAIWLPWALTLRGDHLRRTGWVIAVVGAAISFGILYTAMSGLAGWPIPSILADLQLARGKVSGSGELALGFLAMPILIPICGYVVVGACWRRDPYLPPRWVLAASSVLVCVAGLASGRRGVALTVIIVIALALVGTVFRAVRDRAPLNHMVRRGDLIAPMLTVVALATAVSPLGRTLRRLVVASVEFARAMLGAGKSAPTGGSTSPTILTTPMPAPPVRLNVDDKIRYDQIGAVIRQWKQSPWFGHGFGAPRAGADPTIRRPWRMEIQPLQVLMNVGVIGVLVLLVVGVLCAVEVRRAFRVTRHTGALASATVAAAVLLLANAFNPLLQAVGHVWGVVAVLGIAQAVLTRREPEVEFVDDPPRRQQPQHLDAEEPTR